jgi:hypothetical protein
MGSDEASAAEGGSPDESRVTLIVGIFRFGRESPTPLAFTPPVRLLLKNIELKIRSDKIVGKRVKLEPHRVG